MKKGAKTPGAMQHGAGPEIGGVPVLAAPWIVIGVCRPNYTNSREGTWKGVVANLTT